MEEPETSQHMQTQKDLIGTLKKLSKKAHTQIILTTHSSTVVKCLDYKDIRIVQKNHSVSTVKENGGTPTMYKSLSEINYIVFGDASEEYHDELYGELSLRLHRKFRDSGPKDFEKMLEKEGFKVCETWVKEKPDGTVASNNVVTLQTYIRHSIHHPENRSNTKYIPAQIKQSIEEMRKYLGKRCKGEYQTDVIDCK